MKYIEISTIFACLVLLTSSCGAGASGSLPDSGLSSRDSGQLQNCQTSQKTSLNLLATVAYWPNVRQFLDANCISCHGVGNTRNLDFKEYSSARSTLLAKGYTFDKMVSQIQADHKNDYGDSDKTMFNTWKADGYLELLPGKKVEDYQSSTGSGSGSSGNSTIDSIVSEFEKNRGTQDSTTNNANSENNTFQRPNTGNQPCLSVN